MIKTKFYIPEFGKNLIIRKRLFDILHQNENCKMIIITAPAGYGKTALISSWVTYRKKQKVIWLTLDNEDNDEELFWSYLLMSFYRNVWVPDEMKQKNNTILSNTVAFSRSHLIHFINDIIEIGAQMTMVIDDFGIIKNKKIIDNLQILIRHLPSNIQMILLSRECLNIAIAKYKVSENVFVLTGEELCFTQKETILFFSHIAHIDLSQEEYAEINHTFEGWIAGMQLMALTIKDTDEPVIPQIAKKQSIHTYLMEEIIHKLDSSTKSFLIQISILDKFCSELCDFLFNTDNAEKTIDKFENLNLFIICIDKKRIWFRYHRLFRDFLQTLMQNNEQKLYIYKKASEWYEIKKEWKDAIYYAIEGQDFDRAVNLIEYFSKEIGYIGESRLLHKWNQYLPKEVVQNNLRLLLNSAWAYSSEGNMSKLFWCIEEIRKFETIPTQLQVEITALYSCNLAGPQINLDSILIKCKQALKFLTPKEFLMQLIYFNIGAIFLLKGSIKQSLYYFEKCYVNSIESENFYLAIVSKKAIITSQIRNGMLKKAEYEILEFVKILDDIKLETLPAIGLLYAQLAEIYYQRNELEEALNIATKGVRYGELGADIWTSGENYLILEKIYTAMNNRKQYEIIKLKVLTHMEDKKFFDLNIKLECNHIQTLILDKKLTLASRKINNLEKIINPKLNLIYPEFVLLKAKFYINKGNLKKAEEILISLKTTAKRNEQKGLLCEIQVILSTIYDKLGNNIYALNELEEAVLLAQEQGNFQFFLNEGELIKGMLKRLEQRNSKINGTTFIESLLCCFEIQPIVNELNILSNREIEILNMVAQGARNEEIADRLFVSKNTVKTHLSNIYTKLGVHSRTKAVSKAESLNIIMLH